MRRISIRPIGVIAFLIAALAASACATVRVSKILADPSRYSNRDVRVSGAVVDSYALANRGLYKIDDESGQLWVVSDRRAPRKGARVTVKGTIREGFNLGSLGSQIGLPAAIGSGVVLMESSRDAR